MKEFMKTKKVTYNLMSFTGFKSMLLLSYLMEAPHSYEEIKKYFMENEFIHESISIYTLRVYINSLERLGCEIKRGKKAEGSKYRLIKHPFELKITDTQIKSLIKVFKSLTKTIDVEDLLSVTNFFEKISQGITNPDLKLTLENISPLKKLNPKILEILINACRRNDELTILYNSPASGAKEIDVLAEKLTVANNKVYLKGISPQYKDTKVSFLVSRIMEPPVIKLVKTIRQDIEPLIIGCEIYDTNLPLKENEKVISQDDEKRMVEITSDNKFLTLQRILSMGSSCKVLYPESFKDEIYSTLKKMKEEYIAEKI